MGLLATLRGILTDSAPLPFFEVARRRGLTVEQMEAGVGIARLARAMRRCALCAGKGECRAELTSGPSADPADCPNAALFQRRFDDPVR